MSLASGVGATHLLAEFVALMASVSDERRAMQVAAEHAASAAEAEVCAVLRDGEVVSVGFPRRECPADLMRELAQSGVRRAHLPGVGECHLAVATMSGEVSGHLLLARLQDPFSPDEISLLRATARVLSLSLTMMETLAAERRLREHSDQQAAENARLLRELEARQALVEALRRIEAAIARRDPLREVLDTITEAGHLLLHAQTSALRLLAAPDSDDLRLAAVAGATETELGRRVARSAAPLTDAAMSHRRLVGVDDGSNELPGTAATMSCPVMENDVVVGALTIGRASGQAPFTEGDREALLALADHAGMAVTDAAAVRAVHEAQLDPLTGLPNRAMFTGRLEQALLDAHDRGETAGVLFIDLDRFKPVNDSLGHAAGDALLTEVARRLRSCLRDGDTSSRLGGDEFAVLLPGADVADAVAVAERVSGQIRSPFEVLGNLVHVSASIGVAVSTAGQDAAQVLHDADIAMYRAKKLGEGETQVYVPEMHADMLNRLQLETDLSTALVHRQLVTRYSPVIDLASGSVAAVTVAPYWQHPQRGLLAPEEFLALSAKTEVGGRIERWLLAQGCRELAAWRKAGGTTAGLHLRLEAHQLTDERFRAAAQNVLGLNGLTPGDLTFEVSAQVLADEAEKVSAHIARWQRDGFKIAVRDFGSAPFALADLCGVAPDLVKIDLAGSTPALPPEARRRLIAAARQFSDVVVAQVVGTKEQIPELIAGGCRYGEGGVLSSPVSAADLAREFPAKDGQD
ncbi:diguanylate cyclase [Actinoplanes sp. NPDC049548]|uniref:putative bifunctional diguanylate cyclase/phosphodiesterase n=1 Tax=Actinoplanes sp. NPDC049548 TaxID=3155152 RepID=UPI003430E7CD